MENLCENLGKFTYCKINCKVFCKPVLTVYTLKLVKFENEKLKMASNRMQIQLDEIEYDAHESELEIVCVPETKDENLKLIVKNTIAEKFEMSMPPDVVETCIKPPHTNGEM